MRIEEASRETGLSKDMIRHYEKLDLIRPSRCGNGYRDYTPDDLYLLTLIKDLSNLGIPLKTIGNAFQTGDARAVRREIARETERLTHLKAQIDSRIAASAYAASCFAQFDSGVSFVECTVPMRCLLPNATHLPPEGGEGALFQYYLRQRAKVDGEGASLQTVDRGIFTYSPHPGAECLPAQRCLRCIVAHGRGRTISVEDLARALSEAMRIVGRSQFTVITHMFFLQNRPGSENVICGEILLGEEGM